MNVVMIHAGRSTHDGPGNMSVRAQMKHSVQKIKQVSGYGLQVLVPQSHQPYSQDQSEEPLACFKQGDAAQAKVFCDQALLVIHWVGDEISILYGTLRHGRLPISRRPALKRKMSCSCAGFLASGAHSGGLRGRHGGQEHHKQSAMLARSKPDRAAVLFNDLLAHPQSQPGSNVFLGSKERLPYLVL